MFADVYPIKRLPRRFTHFTYAIPDDLARVVVRGAFVRVPWRSGFVRGVVARVQGMEPNQPAKSLESSSDEPVSEAELAVYEEVARNTFQSVSSVLDAAFPRPRIGGAHTPRHESEAGCSDPASVTSRELNHLTSAAKSREPISFVQTSDLVEATLLAHLVHKEVGAPVLFLLPHEHDVEIARDVSTALSKEVHTCTSDMTEPQRADVARAWRAGELPFLVSTRLGALFVPPKNLGAIVVGRSGINEHAQYDRNPRYDARLVAALWTRERKARLVLADTLPRCADLVSEPKVNLAPDGVEATHIDLNVSSRLSDDPLLSDELLCGIRACLENKTRILLLSQQKGLAGKLRCSSCAFVELCGTCRKPLSLYETHLFCHTCKRATRRPDRCRKCGSAELRPVRRGVRSLTSTLAKLFPDAQIVSVEKGKHPERLDEANMIVATSYFHETFYHPLCSPFGLVAIICADEIVRLAGNSARAARELLEIRGIAQRHKGTFLVQTWDPKLVRSLLREPLMIVQKECSARREFSQAPFVHEIELFGRGKTAGPILRRLVEELKRGSEKGRLTEESRGHWKLLTSSATLLESLRVLDDTIVVHDKTFL